jgi:tRNA(Arg) A34 adenosine deaminase TadA
MAKASVFMAKAIDLALENVELGKGGPFGALIVQNGEILASGANLVTSLNDPTAHAEVVAIRAACAFKSEFQLTDCDLYTTCEPCPMCLGAIYWARLRHVYFACTAADAADAGFDDRYIYEQIARAPADRAIPFDSLMRDEALACFAAWSAKTNRVNY